MVSAWASSNRLVLGQRKVNEKSNEITAIPQLLQVLAIGGCILTIDATGCQKDIARAIVERGADYERTSLAFIRMCRGCLSKPWQQGFRTLPMIFINHRYKGHGAWKFVAAGRFMSTLYELNYLVQKPHWRGLASLAMIQAEHHSNGKVEQETRYYISSLTNGARACFKT